MQLTIIVIFNRNLALFSGKLAPLAKLPRAYNQEEEGTSDNCFIAQYTIVKIK